MRQRASFSSWILAFHHRHDGSTCYLPLMIFDGQSGGFGDENAMIMRRVLKLIRPPLNRPN
ncbi:hypothetical protein CR103_18635 [Massilia psychrophila]|uniref:Uncharacterized protein n=1 Tax=Massilia psychrophila TaxID=1603353 RepID=A0A2G8SX69_9BURK|nr:hypothetical protein CR103_18635 [Massilia psychrophila]